jgi:hypothetical protein
VFENADNELVACSPPGKFEYSLAEIHQWVVVLNKAKHLASKYIPEILRCMQDNIQQTMYIAVYTVL